MIHKHLHLGVVTANVVTKSVVTLTVLDARLSVEYRPPVEGVTPVTSDGVIPVSSDGVISSTFVDNEESVINKI